MSWGVYNVRERMWVVGKMQDGKILLTPDPTQADDFDDREHAGRYIANVIGLASSPDYVTQVITV